MLTVLHQLDSTESRSHHALCWCPPLNGLVCCGGVPDSSRVLSVLGRRAAEDEFQQSPVEGGSAATTHPPVIPPVLLLLPMEELERVVRLKTQAAFRRQKKSLDAFVMQQLRAVDPHTPSAPPLPHSLSCSSSSAISTPESMKEQLRLRWTPLVTLSDPRPRYGHQMFYFQQHLYVVGGMYIDAPALSLADVVFSVEECVWVRVPPLFPPRFQAAMALGRCASEDHFGPLEEASSVMLEVFLFGGVEESQKETNSLFRLCLPDYTYETLPQHGAVPLIQYQGLLVAEVQTGCGSSLTQPVSPTIPPPAAGRLFYVDGHQRGRPMTPVLRVYSLRSGFWRRLRSCPIGLGGALAGVEFGVFPKPPYASQPSQRRSTQRKNGAEGEVLPRGSASPLAQRSSSPSPLPGTAAATLSARVLPRSPHDLNFEELAEVSFVPSELTAPAGLRPAEELAHSTSGSLRSSPSSSRPMESEPLVLQRFDVFGGLLPRELRSSLFYRSPTSVAPDSKEGEKASCDEWKKNSTCAFTFSFDVNSGTFSLPHGVIPLLRRPVHHAVALLPPSAVARLSTVLREEGGRAGEAQEAARLTRITAVSFGGQRLSDWDAVDTVHLLGPRETFLRDEACSWIRMHHLSLPVVRGEVDEGEKGDGGASRSSSDGRRGKPGKTDQLLEELF